VVCHVAIVPLRRRLFDVSLNHLTVLRLHCFGFLSRRTTRDNHHTEHTNSHRYEVRPRRTLLSQDARLFGAFMDGGNLRLSYAAIQQSEWTTRRSKRRYQPTRLRGVSGLPHNVQVSIISTSSSMPQSDTYDDPMRSPLSATGAARKRHGLRRSCGSGRSRSVEALVVSAQSHLDNA
jgi:hypothetical protein